MKYSNDNFTIEDIIFQGNIKEDCLFIDWCVLLECNYKYSYCFWQSLLENAIFTQIEKLKHAINQLFSLEKERYAFTITGGEVTFYPYLFYLIDYIFSFNKNVSAYIITNGSKSISFFDNLMILRNEYEFDINLAELRSGDFFDYVDPRYNSEYIKLIEDSVDIINNSNFVKFIA